MLPSPLPRSQAAPTAAVWSEEPDSYASRQRASMGAASCIFHVVSFLQVNRRARYAPNLALSRLPCLCTCAHAATLLPNAPPTATMKLTRPQGFGPTSCAAAAARRHRLPAPCCARLAPEPSPHGSSPCCYATCLCPCHQGHRQRQLHRPLHPPTLHPPCLAHAAFEGSAPNRPVLTCLAFCDRWPSPLPSRWSQPSSWWT